MEGHPGRRVLQASQWQKCWLRGQNWNWNYSPHADLRLLATPQAPCPHYTHVSPPTSMLVTPCVHVWKAGCGLWLSLASLVCSRGLRGTLEAQGHGWGQAAPRAQRPSVSAPGESAQVRAASVVPVWRPCEFPRAQSLPAWVV